MGISQRALDNLTLLDRVWRGRLSGRLEVRVGGQEERLAVVSGGVYPGPDGLVGLRAAAARGQLRFLVARGEPVAQPGSRAGLAAVIRELAVLLADRDPRLVPADALVRLRVDADLAYEIMNPHLADRLARKPVAAGALLRDGSVGGRELRALELLRLVRIEDPVDAAQASTAQALDVEQAPPPVRPLPERAEAEPAADAAAAPLAEGAGVSWRVDQQAYTGEHDAVFAYGADDDEDEYDEDSELSDAVLVADSQPPVHDPAAADAWSFPGDDDSGDSSLASPLFQDDLQDDAVDSTEDDDDMDSAVAVLAPDDDDEVFACEEDDDDPSSSVFSMSADLLNSMLGSGDDDDEPWSPPVREEPDVEIEDDEGDSWLDSSLDSGMYSAVDSALASSAGSFLDSAVESHSSWTDARPWSPGGGFWATEGSAAGEAVVFDAEGDPASATDDDTTFAELPVVGEDAADDVTEPGSSADEALVFGDRTLEDPDAGSLDFEDTVDDVGALVDLDEADADEDSVTVDSDTADDTDLTDAPLVPEDLSVPPEVPGVAAAALPAELTTEILPAELGADGFLAELQAELLNRARRELLSGAYEEASATLERCDALSPGDPAVKVHRAWARLLAGEYFFARFEAEAAVAMAPADPLVRRLAEALVARSEA